MGVASAVSLGIEANNELGAGTSVTATCQPAGASNDIAVGFSNPTYMAATTSFSVADIILSNVDVACTGLNYKIVVADNLGVSLDESLGVISGPSVTTALAGAVATEDIASVSVVIYNN